MSNLRQNWLKTALISVPAMAVVLGGFNAQADRNPTVIELGSSGSSVTLNEAKVETRYRYQTDKMGNEVANLFEHRALFDVTVSFFEDKVRIDLQGATGGSFSSTWGESGGDSASSDAPDLNFYLRRLSITLAPTKGIELTGGSFGPQLGAGSDSTYLSKEGYIMGYRAKVSYDKGYVVVTGGYVGDFNNPNVFDRFERLTKTDEFNYLQVLIHHQINQMVQGSLDYTRLNGEDYVRGALKISVAKWTKFIDSITVEGIARLKNEDIAGDEVAKAIAVTLKKKFENLLAGRNLEVALTYLYQDGDMKMPMSEYNMEGNSLRLRFACDNLVDFKWGSVTAYIDMTQNLDDLDEQRIEGGIGLVF